MQELEQSKSNLYGDAELNLCESKLGSVKQMIYDDEEDEWMLYNSSTMLEFDEISNCHGNVQSSTVAILQEFSTICFNRSSTMPVEDE